ncbi:hyaluronidase [Streptococcus phage Javan340]|nr:hyaluronidase [Streptococcus phage Javan340]
MLYLLESDTRNVKWNGIPLHEATSAIIKEQMNGDFILTVRYPITDSEIYQLFREDMLIKAPAPVLGPQLFRIKKPVENDDHLEITAYHITDDVMQRSINPLSVNKQSCWQALSQLVQVAKSPINDFSFTSDITDRRTINTKEVETLYSVLMDGAHSIVGTWEGEMVRDNFAISIKRNRGEDRGVIISTHKNLKSYQRTKNSQNIVTRIHAKSTFKAEGAKEDTTIAITVDSPLIGAYPYINERSYTNNNIQTVEELTKWASAKFTNEHIDKATDAIKIEAYELDGQTVHMGDTVNLKSYKHNVDVYKKAIAYEYDCLANNGQGAYLTITFDDKVKSGGSGGGVSAVANAILDKQETKFDIMLERAIANADRAFDAEFAKREKAITDAIEQYKAKAEEVKQGISSEIDKRFQNFDNASIQEAKRKAEEALKNAGASNSLAQEAKTIADQSSAEMNQFKQESSKAQRDLSENINHFKSELQQSLAGKADNATVEQTERALRQKFESLSTDTISKINAAKTEFEKTAQGLSTKITKVETYVNNDGQRQDDLKRYAREESASQARAVREDVTRDFVGKNTFQESVQGVERRLESFSLGTSGNLLKNSNDGFYNQYDKRYRLVETLQANQTYTLVTKYWHGENATGHTFLDGIGNWRRLTYNSAIDAWMVQFTPTKEIPAGTEITLSSDPHESKGNMHWATLVRGAIPLIHWQPARGDVEEGVTQKLAEYKETVDGRFATISSQLNGKANQSDFQRVKETSQLYERILGGSGSSDQTVRDNITRLVMTNQLFQTEVSKYGQGGPNLIKNSGNPSDSSNWGYWEIGQNPAIKTGTHPFFYNQKRKLFFFENNTREAVPVSTIRFPLKRNTSYTVSLTAFNTLNMKGASIFFLGRKTGETQSFTRVEVLIENTKFSTAEAVRKNYTFNSGECDEGFIRIDNNGTTNSDVAILLFGDVDVYEGTTIRPWQPSPEDTNEAVRTVQTQLAGSWAVQNINSAGDIISGINLGATGHNRITGKLTHITGDTLIDNAVIKSAMVDKLKTANFEAGSVTTTILDAEAVTADKVRFDDAFIRKMIANEAFIEQLTSKRIFSTKVESVISSSTFLEAYQGRIGGFTIGHFDQGRGRWISGINQFSVGMGNGEGGSYNGENTAFWANWGYSWDRPGPNAWYVTTSGNMYCRNGADFNGKVDFSNSSSANFYGSSTFVRSPAFLNGIDMGSKEIIGQGGSPRNGNQNAVVWWNQVGEGTVKYWIDKKSDRRLKENITDTAVKALDKINKLNMVAFDFIESKKHEEIGLIAQEAESIVPEVISRDPENPDAYLHIDYTAFVPYLLKAIQELNQKINLMEERYGSII